MSVGMKLGNVFKSLRKQREQRRADAAQRFTELSDQAAAVAAGADIEAPSVDEMDGILEAAGKSPEDLEAEVKKRQEKAKLINQAATIASLKRDIDELNEAKVKAIAKADAFMAKYRAEMAERERQIDALEGRRAAAHMARAKLGEMLPVSETESKLAERKKQLLGQLKGGGILVEKNFAARTQQQINEIGRELEELRNRRLDELLIPAAERLTAATAAERELLAQRKKIEESIGELEERETATFESVESGKVPSFAAPTARLAEQLQKKQVELAEVDRRLSLIREQRASAAK